VINDDAMIADEYLRGLARRVIDEFMRFAVKRLEADMLAIIDLVVNHPNPQHAYRIRRRLARVIIRHLEGRRCAGKSSST